MVNFFSQFIFGFNLKSYTFNKYKTLNKDKINKEINFTVRTSNKEKIEKQLIGIGNGYIMNAFRTTKFADILDPIFAVSK